MDTQSYLKQETFTAYQIIWIARYSSKLQEIFHYFIVATFSSTLERSDVVFISALWIKKAVVRNAKG